MAAKIGNKRVAVISCDFEEDIIGRLADDIKKPMLANAAAVIATAREVGAPVHHVRVAFSKGYPELPTDSRNKLFAGVRKAGKLVEGPGTAIVPEVAPAGEERTFVKRRIGFHTTTDLPQVLTESKIEHVVLMGVSTSGVIMSSVRTFADADVVVTVVSDAVADYGSQAAQDAMLNEIFPRTAFVTTAKEVITSLKSPTAPHPADEEA